MRTQNRRRKRRGRGGRRGRRRAFGIPRGSRQGNEGLFACGQHRTHRVQSCRRGEFRGLFGGAGHRLYQSDGSLASKKNALFRGRQRFLYEKGVEGRDCAFECVSALYANGVHGQRRRVEFPYVHALHDGYLRGRLQSHRIRTHGISVQKRRRVQSGTSGRRTRSQNQFPRAEKHVYAAHIGRTNRRERNEGNLRQVHPKSRQHVYAQNEHSAHRRGKRGRLAQFVQGQSFDVAQASVRNQARRKRSSHACGKMYEKVEYSSRSFEEIEQKAF